MPRVSLPRLGLAALAVGLLAALPWAAHPEDPEPVEKSHGSLAVPFLQKHCLSCHDAKKHEGDVVLTPLVETGGHRRDRALWRKIRERVATKEMPPEDAKVRPSAAEQDAFVAWVGRALSGNDAGGAPDDPGRVTVRRLNRAEYGYTVVDLLHVKPRPADELPTDDVGYGFDRIGDVLSLPPILLERYLSTAESIAAEAILDWKPTRLHVEAEEMKREGSPGGNQGPYHVLYSNGRIETTLQVPWTGEYVLRARACQQPAGNEAARMSLGVDGKEVARFDVTVLDGAAKAYEARVTLEPGPHVVAASFLNDFYQPDAADPKQRDRNLAIDWVELEGPRESPPLPWAHKTYVTKRPAADAKPVQRRNVAREVLGPLVSRAYRRPAKPEELEKLAKLVDLAMTEGETFERGLQLALTGVLVSPCFLFRLELDATRDTPSAELLDENALAARLSYFVWSSLPDEELTREATAGTLRKNLDAQTKRLLADPKATRLVEQFATQWLQLKRFETFAPDPATFPSFDEELRAAARAETLKLFETILRDNRSVRELVDPEFTFVNERLARHYGIEGIAGPELRRVDAPPERRGLLGHASVLMATANPTRTSPVKRGRWVLDVLLDDPPPPPLPGTDSLKEEAAAVTGVTLRERLDKHRSKKECASCHSRMDPLGFALEKFDAIGAKRDLEADRPIDDAGTLPDGAKVDGAPGLRTYLAGKTPRIARSVAKKLLIFGLGRGPVPADETALDKLVSSLGPEPKLQDLVVGLVKLDAFNKRRLEGGKR